MRRLLWVRRLQRQARTTMPSKTQRPPKANAPRPPGPADVARARTRIAGGMALTPCPDSIPLSELLGARVAVKMDYLLRTGSFKERGARNALLQLSASARKQGVIAASAGNHALGLAWHGSLLRVPVTVVMPTFAPLIKIDTCRRLGARVVLHGADFAEATRHARSLAAERGLTYIHGFDHPAIIAGAGVAGLEILEQVPDVEAIVVPVGGGGLAAGIALAVKAAKPSVLVYAVEPQAAPCLQAALAAGKPVDVATSPTLADGLGVSRIGDLPFAVLKDRLDGVVTVSEDEIALAILRLIELEKAVVEGAGASGVAAMLAGRLPSLAGRRVVLPLCGGNIDPSILGRVIEKALVFDGRLTRFTASVSDRPGGLARLADAIAGTGASIRDIVHDRAFTGGGVANVHVVCTVETRNHAHAAELRRALGAAGIVVSG